MKTTSLILSALCLVISSGCTSITSSPQQHDIRAFSDDVIVFSDLVSDTYIERLERLLPRHFAEFEIQSPKLDQSVRQYTLYFQSSYDVATGKTTPFVIQGMEVILLHKEDPLVQNGQWKKGPIYGSSDDDNYLLLFFSFHEAAFTDSYRGQLPETFQGYRLIGETRTPKLYPLPSNPNRDPPTR